MRIWSIHPQYLDAKGIVALWREALLAKHVLEGKTKGYKNHPQLNRFKQAPQPLNAINAYLTVVYEEALARNYRFSKQKITPHRQPCTLTVTKGQIAYETHHLLQKLKTRNLKKFDEISSLPALNPHPLFTLIEGGIEKWEMV